MRCASPVPGAALSALLLWLYHPGCVAAVDPALEPIVKPKVSAELWQLLKSDAVIDLAHVCEDEVSTDGETRFRPVPLPDIVVHLREGSASLAAAKLVPEPTVAKTRLVYVNRDTGLGFIVVRFERLPAGKLADQRGAIVELASHGDVRHVEPNCRYRSAAQNDVRAEGAARVAARAAALAAPRPDPLFPDQWGLKMLPAPDAWQLADPQARPLVAVLDSGVDCTNPDLHGQLRVSGAGDGRCPPGVGWDFVQSDDDPSDCGETACNSHGTHMAAIIAATTDNGLGIAAVAPNAMLLIVRTTDEFNVPTDLASRALAIRYAIDQGAKILNISQEWRNWSKKTMQRALEYASGTLVNVAAGNQGMGLEANPPNSFANVSYVMALRTAHALWPDSNRACWKRRSILAPGFKIHAAIVRGSVRQVSGTSPATAFVSGAYALLLSVPAHQNMTAIQIHQLLFDTVPQASFSIAGRRSQCKPQMLCLASLVGKQCPER